MPPMRATQASIAQRSGVAQSTVSKILRDPQLAPFNQEVRDRVLTAARELGYKINERRRRLLTYLSVQPEAPLDDAYYARFHQGLLSAASRCGFRLEIDSLVMGSRPGSAESIHGCAAIIQCRGTESDEAFKRVVTMHAERMPTIILNGKIWGGQCSAASADDAEGIGLAVRLASASGHTRIAFLGVGRGFNSPKHDARLMGFLRTMSQLGLRVPDAYIHLTSPEISARPEGTRRDVEAGLDSFYADSSRPTCIVCSADALAAALYDIARARHIAIPQELSVTGFDNIPGIEHLRPGLTTIDQRIGELAIAAIEEIERRLHDRDATPRQIVIAPQLIVRDSVARLAS